MTAQSLLVVLREKELRLRSELNSRFGSDRDKWGESMMLSGLGLEITRTSEAIRVIEEVLKSTRETRKEFGDNTLESEADLGLGSSTPS